MLAGCAEGIVTCSVGDHGPPVPVANWPCGELEETETVTSPACGGDTSTCMAAEGWPAVSACAPEPNERAAGGGAPEAGVTANSHVRQDVVESVPFARLYWLPSHTVPADPVAAGSGLAPE